MARPRPTVLFIVEGATDKNALEKIFQQLYKQKAINFEYTLTSIKCKYPQNVVDRNERKSKIMNYLISLQSIKGISYDKYFMSCNLDHALYNEQNLPKDLKQDYADEFYATFKDAPRAFVEFLKEDVVNGVPSSYPQSWKYIKEELHSLERHTNLNIYFDKYPIDFML